MSFDMLMKNKNVFSERKRNSRVIQIGAENNFQDYSKTPSLA
jgi:hypothetical protein